MQGLFEGGCFPEKSCSGEQKEEKNAGKRAKNVAGQIKPVWAAVGSQDLNRLGDAAAKHGEKQGQTGDGRTLHPQREENFPKPEIEAQEECQNEIGRDMRHNKKDRTPENN